MAELTIVLIVSIVIVFVVLLLAVLTTSKAYSIKHTVDPDPIENNPYMKNSEEKNGK
ncbi:YtzI protein [Neobacillus mesonae]|uniref:YtzI protein n=1 Tax=Neobacillus mesonae TaxID=1193713 RepID=UPI003D9BD814